MNPLKKIHSTPSSPDKRPIAETQRPDYIDKNLMEGENGGMFQTLTAKRSCAGILLAGSVMASSSIAATQAIAASPLYWCPDRKADQQYSATKGPGCIPLTEKKEPQAGDSAERPPRDFKIENLQREALSFLDKYRQFLDCCKTDLTELQQIEELGNEVGDLLTFAQANLSNHSLASRGIMLRELIPPIAKARADLKTLHAKLQRLGEAASRRDQADLEEAGRESRTMREIEESIDKDIHAPKLQGSAKTGANIGVAPTAGPNIGKTPKSGSAIGSEGLVGQEIGASPKSSSTIGASGPTGFDIGATGRAGPAIGESALNSDSSSSVGSSLQGSTVNSTLSDSSVGSSLGSSTVGSSLQDTSVGSSLGGSSVGSNLHNRATGQPQ